MKSQKEIRQALDRFYAVAGGMSSGDPEAMQVMTIIGALRWVLDIDEVKKGSKQESDAFVYDHAASAAGMK